MDDAKLEALARAGGICCDCGGVHVSIIDIALLAEAVGLETCDCEDCHHCERVRNAVEALEVYQDLNMPPEYSHSCGVVLVWMRRPGRGEFRNRNQP